VQLCHGLLSEVKGLMIDSLVDKTIVRTKMLTKYWLQCGVLSKLP
jgi:hypothetical protein